MWGIASKDDFTQNSVACFCHGLSSRIWKLNVPRLMQYLGARVFFFFVISGISVFMCKTNDRLKGLYSGCWLKNLTYVGKGPIWKDYKYVFSYCDLCLFEWEAGQSRLTHVRAPCPASGHGAQLMASAQKSYDARWALVFWPLLSGTGWQKKTHL